jgi:hypothetical protein
MTIVLRGEIERAGRLATTSPASLVVSVGAEDELASAEDAPVARVGVAVRDPALARALIDAMADAVVRGAATDAEEAGAGGASASCNDGPRATPVVRARSRKAVERLGVAAMGALALVPVTLRNRGRLPAIVEMLRRGGVAGVQLVWDGEDPPRSAVEARVFSVLEAARASPRLPPVVLSSVDEPVEALRILADRRP